MEFRIMTEADVKAVSEIEAVSIKRPWSYDSLLDAAKNPAALYVVAVDEGEVAGFVGMWVSFEEAEITSVAIRPDKRRRGIARALLGKCAEYARERSVEKLFLEVRQSNEAAKALYENTGFSTLAVRPRIYENPVEDGYLMMKRI